MRAKPGVTRARAALLTLMLLHGFVILGAAQPSGVDRAAPRRPSVAESDASGADVRTREHTSRRELRLLRRRLQGHGEATLGQVEKFERELDLAQQTLPRVPLESPLASASAEWGPHFQEPPPPGPPSGEQGPGQEVGGVTSSVPDWTAQPVVADQDPSTPPAPLQEALPGHDGPAAGSSAKEPLPLEDALTGSALHGPGTADGAPEVAERGGIHAENPAAVHSQSLHTQVLEIVEQSGGAERSTHHVPPGSTHHWDSAFGPRNASAIPGEGQPPGERTAEEDPSGRGTTAAPYETTLWIPEIRYSALRMLDLRYYQGLHCRGGDCPAFEECANATESQQEEGARPGRVRACWNADLLDPAPIVSDPALNALWERHAEAPAAAPVPGTATGVQHRRRLREQEADIADAQAPRLREGALAPAAAQPQPKHSWDGKLVTAEDVQDGDAYAGQLFELENVFVNDRGSIMNEHTLYRHALFCRTCPLDFGVYLGNTTVVTVFEEMLTLAYWNGANFYHAMVEVLPNLVVARRLLEQKPRIPVALRMLQDLHGHVFDLIGQPMETLNIHVLPDDQLFFARRLYVPAQAPCGRPSQAALAVLRANYLVPPWPLLLRSAAAVSDDPSIVARAAVNRGQWQREGATAAPGASDGDNEWYVAVGHRESTRRIVGREQLYEALRARFSPSRIVLFDGNMTIQAARDLFNNVRLFISPHGALMTNMMFMPAGAHVVEVRPSAFNNGCYHYLAHILGMRYYLLRGNGTKESDLHVDLPRLLAIVQDVADKLQEPDAITPSALDVG